MAMLTLNSNIQLHYERIGEEKTPIIIIDDYLNDPQILVTLAKQQTNFKTDDHTQYPGLRTPLPKHCVVDYLKPLMQGFYKVFNIKNSLAPHPKDNTFSLITTPAEQLCAIQTLPHFDTNSPNLIAIIHYLGEGDHGGTGFFRHKKTGFETISTARRHAYLNHVEEFLNQHPNKRTYCSAKHSEFECYKQIPYKKNRLIIFPGYLLHSSLVNTQTDISVCPQTGRLTANMFVQFN